MLLLGITLLLVEDDADNLELMAAYFDGEGAHTLSASSVTAALAMTSVARVDVLVSDLELLDGDGCDLLQQLRQREGMQALPAVAITGYSDRKWLEKAADSGFARYAVKPFSLTQLVGWIAELSAPAASGQRDATSLAPEIPAARGRRVQ